MSRVNPPQLGWIKANQTTWISREILVPSLPVLLTTHWDSNDNIQRWAEILKNISIKATQTHRFFRIKSNNAIQSVQQKENLVSETIKKQKIGFLLQ
jgi:hypothetical protein